MKRFIIIVGLVLLIVLSACDRLVPQETTPTQEAGEATTAAEDVTTAGEPTPTVAAPTDGTQPALTGTTWQWASLTTPVEETAVADPSRYTITFNDDGTANIMADCNSVRATYTSAEDGTISITLGATTLVACPPDSQEQLFLSSLSNAAIYFFQDGNLFIDLFASAGTMRFITGATPLPEAETPAMEPTLTRTVWTWVSLTTPVEETTIADPARYTITFNDDGTANIMADCNSVSATYTTTEDGTISITLGASTRVACPPDTQDQLYLASLSNAAIYFFQDGDLYIDLFADSGTMRFAAAAFILPEAEGGEETGTEPTLTGTTWEWASLTTPLEETTIADPTRYTIIFNEDGTANIKADCNNIIASYTADGGSLSLTLGPSTLVACPADTQDTLFRDSLSNAAVYSFQEGDLLIDLLADAGTMRFTAAEPSLTGVTWQWQATTTPEGEIASADPTRYTVIFNEDGTANIMADCNQMIANFTTDGVSTLDIEMGITTLAACSPESQDGMFRNNLDNAAIYFFQDGDLFIDLVADGGTMRFTQAVETETLAPTESTQPTQSSPPLVGTSWQWVSLTTPVGETAVADPTRYTISFNEGGQATIRADCNYAGATYTTNESNIDITLTFSTLVACPPDSQETLFRDSLENAVIYFVQEGDLFLDLPVDSGTMRLTPTP